MYVSVHAQTGSRTCQEAARGSTGLWVQGMAVRAGQGGEHGASTNLDSTGALGAEWGDRKLTEGSVGCVEKVAACFSLAPPPTLTFSSFSYCIFCFHLASLLKLRCKKYCIPMPVLHSLNSKPAFITMLC